MEKGYQEVASYYDHLWAEIEKKNQSGILSRHRIILNKLKKAGFNSKSTLLEIGCGNGTLSAYLASKAPAGKIDAVDISAASIENAKRKHVRRKNLEFFVSDMTHFNISNKYDFILFPDVLEHIPVEAHDNIFKTVRNLCHDTSLIAINLPTPRSLRWHKKNSPELLQIIDQDIESDVLINKLYKNDFYLVTKETYALYTTQPDYEWFIFKVQKEFNQLAFKSKFSVLINNLKIRIQNLV